MVKKLISVLFILVLAITCTACAPKNNGLALTVGNDLDSAPLEPLKWGMTEQELLEALHLSESDVIYRNSPYEWLRADSKSPLPQASGTMDLSLSEPVSVLGGKPAQVVFRFYTFRGLIPDASAKFILSEIYTWYPYENESSLTSLQDGITKQFGESSPVKLDPFSIRFPETTLDPNEEWVWYSKKSQYDVLSPEAKEHYRTVENKATGDWQTDDWNARMKASYQTSVDLLYSPDIYYNQGKGGYAKQDPPLIELRFNGDHASIAKALGDMFPSKE